MVPLSPPKTVVLLVTGPYRGGAFPGTTGETRLLELKPEFMEIAEFRTGDFKRGFAATFSHREDSSSAVPVRRRPPLPLPLPPDYFVVGDRER